MSVPFSSSSVKMGMDEHSTKTVAWRNYTYWELWTDPELQAEYDAMLAERPDRSRAFVSVMVLLLAVFLLGSVLATK